MSFVNRKKKEVICKLVYCGPSLGGKTSNIQHIYKKLFEKSNGEIISFGAGSSHTLLFDFLPLDFGNVGNFKARIHLYSIPGQKFYEEGQKIVLRGVDGIVFVADSQIEKMKTNIKYLYDLEKDLNSLGYNFKKTPVVMQWNKRDLDNISSIEEMNTCLNNWNFPSLSSEAINGEGVLETFKLATKLVMLKVQGNF